MADIVTLQEARASGAPRYFTGVPCKNGHVAERQTSNRGCVICLHDRVRTNRALNYDRVHALELESQRVRRASNPAKHIAEVRAWQIANPDKRRATRTRWKKANPSKVASDSSARRAKIRNQMCDCCTAADFAIVYQAARLIGAEVDHVVPIALGGLHCTMNLQILPPEAHRAKSRDDISRSQTLRHAKRKAARGASVP